MGSMVKAHKALKANKAHKNMSLKSLISFMSFHLMSFLYMLLPCHAYDPNTIIIKHQSGKASKAILDRKFIHVAAPVQNQIDHNTQTDSGGLKSLSIPSIKLVEAHKALKADKAHKTHSIDNSIWDDYSEDVTNSENETLEELNVKANLL